MNDLASKDKRVAAYSLHAWEHTSPTTRLVAPWQQAGITLVQATHWDQVSTKDISRSDLVHIHRDFPRLAKSYRQIMDQARQLGKPVLYDLDDLLLDLPLNHPDRQFYYKSDALFPVLQAIVEADAVTVSTPALQAAVQPLNPQTWLLPTCLDDTLWSLKAVESRANPLPLVLGWIYDRPQLTGLDGFVTALVRFLQGRGDSALLRVWGCKPPDPLLALPNLDWQAELPLEYSSFAAHVSSQDCDLYVIPHPDQNAYFRSQSPLRYFELSACGAPGIFSRTPPYPEVIEHKRNGWLASTSDEWLSALNSLADSADLRGQVARAAQETVSQSWLLSQNSHRWLDAFNQAHDAAVAHAANLPVSKQVAQVSDQVRSWQRDLEQRNNDREWEVRALNVMQKRKEREASGYIEELGAQLEEFWHNPAWRILTKPSAWQNGSSLPTVEAALFPLCLTAVLAPLASNRPPEQSATANSAIVLPPWHLLGRMICYFSLTQPGMSCPKTCETSSPNSHNKAHACLSPRQAQQPPPTQSSRRFKRGFFHSRCLPMASTPKIQPRQTRSRQFFDRLRVQAGIHTAVCWIDEPAHTSLPYLLRNNFGWKIISSLPDQVTVPNPRCDLQIHSPLPSTRFAEIQAALQDLFPKVSLIILTYNNLDYTRQCLESIFTKTIYPNYEIVVVDNASTDGTPDYLRSVAASHPNVRLVLNDENRGFASGNNQGVHASSGEYICFLNNDVIVTPGWLSGLLTHLSDPSIGAVGPVTNYAGNESRISVDYHHISDLDNFARRYTQAHAGQAFDIRMLALFCMLLRRTVIESVGLLDEQFGVGMYEDDDFSLRIRQKGYRILCAEDVYIHHWGSAAFSQLAQERFERLHLENRQKFESKWGTDWQTHRWRMDEA